MGDQTIERFGHSGLSRWVDWGGELERLERDLNRMRFELAELNRRISCLEHSDRGSVYKNISYKDFTETFVLGARLGEIVSNKYPYKIKANKESDRVLVDAFLLLSYGEPLFLGSYKTKEEAQKRCYDHYQVVLVGTER